MDSSLKLQHSRMISRQVAIQEYDSGHDRPSSASGPQPRRARRLTPRPTRFSHRQPSLAPHPDSTPARSNTGLEDGRAGDTLSAKTRQQHGAAVSGWRSNAGGAGAWKSRSSGGAQSGGDPAFASYPRVFGASAQGPGISRLAGFTLRDRNERMVRAPVSPPRPAVGSAGDARRRGLIAKESVRHCQSWEPFVHCTRPVEVLMPACLSLCPAPLCG
jgi:hypothetical protein